MALRLVELGAEEVAFQKDEQMNDFTLEKEGERKLYANEAKVTLLVQLGCIALLVVALLDPNWATRTESLVIPNSDGAINESCTLTTTVGIWEMRLEGSECSPYIKEPFSTVHDPGFMCQPCNSDDDDSQADRLATGAPVSCVPSAEACRVRGKSNPCSRLERYCLETDLAESLSITSGALLGVGVLITTRLIHVLSRTRRGSRHPGLFVALVATLFCAAVAMMVVYRELSDDLGTAESIGWIPRDRISSGCVTRDAAKYTTFEGNQVEICFVQGIGGNLMIAASITLACASFYLLKNACTGSDPAGSSRILARSYRTPSHFKDDELQSLDALREKQHPYIHFDVTNDDDVLNVKPRKKKTRKKPRDQTDVGEIEVTVIQNKLEHDALRQHKFVEDQRHLQNAKSKMRNATATTTEAEEEFMAVSGKFTIDGLEEEFPDASNVDETFRRTPLPSWARSSGASLSAIAATATRSIGMTRDDTENSLNSSTVLGAGQNNTASTPPLSLAEAGGSKPDHFLSATDSHRQMLLEDDTEFLYELLVEFYAIHDPDKKIDTIREVVRWTRVTGIERLNSVLNAKYGVDLNTFAVGDPTHAQLSAEALLGMDDSGDETDLREKRAGLGLPVPELLGEMFDRSSAMEPHDEPDPSTPAGSVANSLATTRWPMSKLRLYVYAFYRAFDPKKLRNGADQVVRYAYVRGIHRLNEGLLKYYNADLDDLHPNMVEREVLARNEIKEKLSEFYRTHAPEASQGSVDEIVEWTMRHGVGHLNKKLRKKYNAGIDIDMQEAEKLRVADLIYRYYAKHDPDATVEQVNSFIEWSRAVGVEQVNTLLQTKYGFGLDSVEVDLDASESNIGSFWNLNTLKESGVVPSPGIRKFRADTEIDTTYSI